jgi:hypothetical protein
MISPRYVHILIVSLFLASCAKAQPTVSAARTPTSSVKPSPTLAQAATEAAGPAETPTLEALPAATSRGPNLEATDPSSVRLASGGLQLVEFFRFT